MSATASMRMKNELPVYVNHNNEKTEAKCETLKSNLRPIANEPYLKKVDSVNSENFLTEIITNFVDDF